VTHLVSHALMAMDSVLNARSHLTQSQLTQSSFSTTKGVLLRHVIHLKLAALFVIMIQIPQLLFVTSTLLNQDLYHTSKLMQPQEQMDTTTEHHGLDAQIAVSNVTLMDVLNVLTQRSLLPMELVLMTALREKLLIMELATHVTIIAAAATSRRLESSLN